MEYTIVEMKEKKFTGKVIRTTYTEDRCFSDLPKAWDEFLNQGIMERIGAKVAPNAVGLYFAQKGMDFHFIPCCEVTEKKNEDLELIIVPASNYAKFSVEGQSFEIIGQSWKTIGAMELDRNTGFDYEVYNADGTVDFYVSVK